MIINGSSKELGSYVGQIIEKNETVTYKWTVVPTDNWAGGNVPLDFYYQLDELGSRGKKITSGEFTAAYITVSEEYYDGAPAEVSTESATKIPQKLQDSCCFWLWECCYWPGSAEKRHDLLLISGEEEKEVDCAACGRGCCYG